ncbi:hypothetical protein I7I50_05731 [Histoplasma capsulatum G186AR]|nr:hypothetical protein I7I52_03991 [Histoplasma capsulatum]QSS76320.1 hypothetical protein I7I50_05731 [Histoplasma capsulatum G186AR]
MKMNTSFKPKEKLSLLDRLKKCRWLSLQCRRALAVEKPPLCRNTVSIEYLSTPDVRIHIVELARSSVPALDIKESEGRLAKLKRRAHLLFRRKDNNARAAVGDEINALGGHGDSQTPALTEKSNRRAHFPFLRKFFRSQTAAEVKPPNTSSSIDYVQKPLLHQSSLCSSIVRKFSPSAASTAEMDLSDWAPLTTFPKSRPSGAKQMETWQISPAPTRVISRPSGSGRNIELGRVQLAPLERKYRKNRRTECPVTNWLDGLPNEQPRIRRMASVDNLHELMTSHSS